jgi:hypothetical protein
LHSDERIERAARLAEAGEPIGPVQPIPDVRAIADAVDAGGLADARVGEAIALARARGRSWGQIALALGVSRQAARERFAHQVDPQPRNG